VELPAHTSNWLQPCDRTVFKPFKDAYNEARQDLMHSYPGTMIGHANFCGLLAKAWNKAITAENITSGFRACGIYPFNPAQVPQEAFIPNTLYVVVDGNNTMTDKNGVSDLDQTAVPAERVDSSTPVPSQDNNTEQQPCPPELALHAVELSLREAVLAKYKYAYVNNRHMNDYPIYTTWKMYKNKCMLNESVISAEQPAILQPVDINNNCDPDADVLRMPEPQIRKRNNQRSDEKIFHIDIC